MKPVPPPKAKARAEKRPECAFCTDAWSLGQFGRHLLGTRRPSGSTPGSLSLLHFAACRTPLLVTVVPGSGKTKACALMGVLLVTFGDVRFGGGGGGRLLSGSSKEVGPLKGLPVKIGVLGWRGKGFQV